MFVLVSLSMYISGDQSTGLLSADTLLHILRNEKLYGENEGVPDQC